MFNNKGLNIHNKLKTPFSDKPIEYAIRAKTSAAMRTQIAVVSASDWIPFLDKKGKRSVVSGQDTYRTSFCIGDYAKAFTLIIQRTTVIGQTSLDLGSPDNSEDLNSHNKCNTPKSVKGYTRTLLTDEKKGVKHDEIYPFD